MDRFAISISRVSMLTRDKNHYFYHIFVSLEDAPGAITLNVVWMDREYDAYCHAPDCQELT